MVDGIVIETTGSWHKVQTRDKKIVLARLKGKMRLQNLKVTNPIAVGDRVVLENSENDHSVVISKIKERKNKIIRQSPRKRRHYHILASNIDQAFIVGSVKMPRTKTGFINRVLVGLEFYEIKPILIFNKIDIYSKKDFNYLEELETVFQDIGYRILRTSTTENIGLAELQELTKNKTSVVTGPSGVGKSSILNWLDPTINLKTKSISGFNEKGQHTTTATTMYPLENNGFLIDTPGIKEYGVADIDAYELSFYFPEMKRIQDECKFNNCQHINEPNCKVIEAVSKGDIATWRYDSYLTIRKELLIENKHYL